MSFFFLLFQDGTILDENTELALVDAVLPDIVATRRTLLQDNKPLREIKHESSLDGGSHYPNDNYKRHNEVMDIDGGVTDFGNYKATLLKGHDSEVMIYSKTPPSAILVMVTLLLDHFFWPPGRYYHTFSCKKTSLIWLPH